MAGIERTIHIIPLGHEIDRAIIPFEKTKADHVYILTGLEPSNNHREMNEQQIFFANTVKKKLEEKGIKVTCEHVDLFDLRNVMNCISKIIIREKGNRIFVNMSAAGRLTSVAATLVGMAHDVHVYYVNADQYPDDPEKRKEHGLSICQTADVTVLTNFQIVRPDSIGLEILIFLFRENKRKRMTDILEFMQTKQFEGFEEKLPKKKLSKQERAIQSRQLMKLDKTILAKLERDGFIKRRKDGRVVYIALTDTGNYTVHISGMLE